MKHLIFILLVGLGRLGQAQLSFTDAPFEKLDEDALVRLSENAPDETSRRLGLLFLSELRFIEGKPHAGTAALTRLLKTCDVDFEATPGLEDRALSRLACAIGFAESAARRPLFFAAVEGLRIRELLEAGLRESSNADDRAYAEARVLGALPKSAGGATGKALLQWEILLRRRPDLFSALFHQAKIRLFASQTENAQKLLERIAKEDPDNRRLVLFRHQPFALAVRDLVDGRTFGIGPVLGVTPLAGFLFGARAYDDAVFDTDRRILVRGSYGTSQEAALNFRYEDAATLASVSDLTFQVSAQFVSRFEDFYPQRYDSVSSTLDIQRAGFEVGLRQPIVDDFYLQVGWRWNETRVFAGPQAGTEPFGGWSATLGFDSTDSRAWKRTGTEASISGFYGDDFSRGSRLELWTMKGAYYRPLWLGTLKLEGALFEGASTPLGALTRLSGEHRIPGLREGRYWAPSAFVGTVSMSANFWQDAWGEVGVHGISLRTSLASLTGLRVGVSGALQYGIGKLRSQSVRIEMGLFGDEFIVMGAGGGGSCRKPRTAYIKAFLVMGAGGGGSCRKPRTAYIKAFLCAWSLGALLLKAKRYVDTFCLFVTSISKKCPHTFLLNR